MTIIIGIGNPHRNDDGVGIHVVRWLDEVAPEEVRVVELTREGTELTDIWDGCDTVYIIDAVRSGAPAGTIHRIDAIKQTLPRNFFLYSSHQFGLAEAIEVARTLKKLPDRLIIYGIEGENFDAGETLSPAVESSVDDVVERIFSEIMRE